MQRGLCFAVLAFMLAACVIREPAPEASASPEGMVGLLEIRIESMGEGVAPTAIARFLNPQRLETDLSAEAINSFPMYTDPNLVFQAQSVSSVDINDFAATNNFNTTGATRYITATFNITNNTAVSFNSLNLHATSVPPTPGVPGAASGTIGGTTFSEIRRGSGTLFSRSNASHVNYARKFLPSTGVGLSANGVAPVGGLTDFQIFTTAEASNVKTQAAAFSTPLDIDPLEYGFVARNLTSGRNIPNGGGTGRVTLGFKLPKIIPTQNTPASFVMYYVVTNESSPFVSQSAEEHPDSLFNGSFDTAIRDVRVLEGSRLIFRDDLLPFCGILTSRQRSPVANTYYSPARGTGSAAFVAVANEPDCAFGASGRRAATFGSNDVVAGMTNNGTTVYVVGTTSSGQDVAIWSVLGNGKTNTAFSGDGELEIDFGGNDVGAAITFDSFTGDLFVAGSSNGDIAVARVNTNGTLDTAFDGDGKVTVNTGGTDQASDVLVDGGGRVVVAGTNFIGSSADFVVVRFNVSGSLDTSFSSEGIASATFGSNDLATSVALDGNGRIVIGGYTDIDAASTGPNDFAIIRMNADGTLDTSFSTDGRNTVNFGNDDRIWDIAVYPNSNPTNGGRIVGVGQWDGGASDFAVVRFGTDGNLDTSFSGDGKFNATFGGGSFGGAEFARAVSLNSAGRIYVTGYTSSVAGATPPGGEDIGIIRLTSAGALDTTFDTDGKKTLDIYNSDDQAFATLLDGAGDLMIASTLVSSSSDFALTRLQK